MIKDSNWVVKMWETTKYTGYKIVELIIWMFILQNKHKQTQRAGVAQVYRLEVETSRTGFGCLAVRCEDDTYVILISGVKSASCLAATCSQPTWSRPHFSR